MSHSEKVQALLEAIDAKQYGKTRNYISGSVSELGPYVSRGVISTRMVWVYLLARGHSFEEMFGFVQQLAWRDFFQRVWMGLGDGINEDLAVFCVLCANNRNRYTNINTKNPNIYPAYSTASSFLCKCGNCNIFKIDLIS